MAASKPSTSASEDAAFLDALLSNDDYWNAAPSPEVPRVLPGVRDKENTSPQKKRAKISHSMSPVNPKSPKKNPSQPLRAIVADFDVDAFLQGSEDWDMDIELSPVKLKTSASQALEPSRPTWNREPFARCHVERVSSASDTRGYYKCLLVRISKSEERRTVRLRDDWNGTEVNPGDIVNVIGTFISSSIDITSKENLLVLHPDMLLTPSTLASAPHCGRKPLLGALIRSNSAASGDNASMVWGNMLHEVMQNCLRDQIWSESHLNNQIESVVRQGLTDLVTLGVTSIDAAVKEVKDRAVGLMSFAEKYLSDSPKDSAVLEDTRAEYGCTSVLAITSLHDVEEDIWSPTFGLKGKLDATMETKISTIRNVPLPQHRAATVTSHQDGIRPFEIKTGRPNLSSEHRAQTMLYTLLLSERYNTPVESGLLYYTQSEEVILVPRGRHEIRGLITGRNAVAGYMVRRHKFLEATAHEDGGGFEAKEPEFLPRPIDDERMCKRCYVGDSCMLYRKAVESLPPPNDPILADLFDRRTSHLTDSHTTFFKKWERLISYEELDMVRFRKELWTMKAEEREKRGRCFSSMVLDRSTNPTKPADATKIHQHTYRFVRAATFVPKDGQDGSLLSGHLNIGDAIVISVEPNLLALSRGYIIDLEPTSVIVGVDRPLDEDAFRRRIEGTPLLPAQRVHFRLDKDELQSGLAKVRHNLAQVFYSHGHAKSLSLLVDLEAPVFSSSQLLPPTITHLISHLNSSQQAAIAHVLSAEDYSLILGMPGTGKTTIIAALIRCLIKLGKTVLLTSYTHSAVDNVLLKFSEEEQEFGILRIGNTDKIHPQIRKFSLSARRKAESVEQLEIQLMSPPLVATTCLSIDHAVFSRREFDVCIVDEASQITLPTCLGPLRFAKSFVLVGDHYQLPPLVRNPTARKGGLDVSLFRRLSEAHPNAVVDLVYQYRMNEDIMTLSNTLIYDNRLKCGSEEVARRSLNVPQKDTFLKLLHKEGQKGTCKGGPTQCWIEHVLSPDCNTIFLDTDSLPALDSRVGDLVQNEIEADLVYQLTEALLASGVAEFDIGLISLYRQQIKILAHRLQARPDVEILTADRSQGRDKECVIISLVRSNAEGLLGDLVKDWRRMNVSFTRARSKLVIFGSRKTLQGEPLLKDFFKLMSSRGWILALPPKAHLVHADALCRAKQGKRSSEEPEERVDPQTPKRRKMKTKMLSEEAIVKGRPILNDLLRGMD